MSRIRESPWSSIINSELGELLKRREHGGHPVKVRRMSESQKLSQVGVPPCGDSRAGAWSPGLAQGLLIPNHAADWRWACDHPWPTEGQKVVLFLKNHHICPLSVVGLGNGAGANIITRWEVKLPSNSNREAWIQESQVRNDAPDSRARNSDGEQHSHWKSRKVHWQTEGASWWQLWLQYVLLFRLDWALWNQTKKRD